MARILMKGNEAMAEAAIQAGCQALLRLSHYTSERDSGVFCAGASSSGRIVFAG